MDFILQFIGTYPVLATALFLVPWLALAVVVWTNFLKTDTWED